MRRGENYTVVVSCSCGCGAAIRLGDRRASRRGGPRYIHGHNAWRSRPELCKPVFCKCGCGGKIADKRRDAHHKWLLGHDDAAKKQTSLKLSAALRGKTKPPRTTSHRAMLSLSGSKGAHKGEPKPWLRGEKNPNWTGGHWTKRCGAEWRAARLACLKRDWLSCQRCTVADPIWLDVHHLVPYEISKTHEDWNLITLCKSCHKTVDLAFRRANWREACSWGDWEAVAKWQRWVVAGEQIKVLDAERAAV